MNRIRRFWTRDDEAVYAAISRGTRYAADIAREIGVGPGLVYVSLEQLENDGRVVGEFEAGQRPRRRAYRARGE